MSTADQLQPSSRVMAHEVDKVARLKSLQFSCVFKTAVKYQWPPWGQKKVTVEERWPFNLFPRDLMR